MLSPELLRSGGPDDDGGWPFDPAAFESNYCGGQLRPNTRYDRAAQTNGNGAARYVMLPTLCWLTNGLQGALRDQRCPERPYPRE
jgi:hypothetical protein